MSDRKTKICTKCHKDKILSDFPKRKGCKYGVAPACHSCRYIWEKEWKRRKKLGLPNLSQEKIYKHPPKGHADNYRSQHYLYNYGITIAEYNEIYKNQNGCCAICKKHQAELIKVLHVDHDHKNQKIRGLLCYKCNVGLGSYNDDVELLLKAIEYLKLFS